MNDNTLPPTPKEFWSDVWKEGVIRFHQKDYNQAMVHFFKDIDLKNKTVLIPLAGKTNDILFFLEKGANVTAIEFYEGAVEAFFKENAIAFTKKEHVYSGTNITFYAGDFFEYKNQTPFDVMYDRASQVVFNQNDRPRYYQHMSSLINARTILFSGAIDHQGPADYGPPFKISPEEVISAYKKMGITLQMASSRQDPASEKMQAAGVQEVKTYFLSNIV
nr:thiopurine S-methyltransferase Se/Te detoxification family [Bacteriovorax sp. HI3]